MRTSPASAAPHLKHLKRIAACLLLSIGLAACGNEDTSGDPVPEQGAERTALSFTGSVEAVDTLAGTVTVRNDDVPGWMGPMSMSYRLDPPTPLRDLRPGDRVRATVYTGDFATLYGLQVVTP